MEETFFSEFVFFGVLAVCVLISAYLQFVGA